MHNVQRNAFVSYVITLQQFVAATCCFIAGTRHCLCYQNTVFMVRELTQVFCRSFKCCMYAHTYLYKQIRVFAFFLFCLSYQNYINSQKSDCLIYFQIMLYYSTKI